MLLFLDFDGVLHPRAPGKNLFIHLPRIQKVLRDFPFLQIVISSSWREGKSPQDLQDLFDEDLRKRIIGTTPLIDIQYPPGPVGHREEEILIFMAQSEYLGQEWLALDDEAPFFSPGCPNLILCNSATGMDDIAENNLRERLHAGIDANKNEPLTVANLKGMIAKPSSPISIKDMNDAIKSEGKKLK